MLGGLKNFVKDVAPPLIGAVLIVGSIFFFKFRALESSRELHRISAPAPDVVVDVADLSHDAR